MMIIKCLLRFWDFVLTILIILIRYPLRLLCGKEKRNEMLRSSRWKFYHYFHFKRLELRLNPEFGFTHEEIVRNFVKTIHGNLFIDVGANYGYYSVLLNRNFKKIFAIEPHPKNIKSLCHNTRNLRNVLCLKVAVGDNNDVAPLFLSINPGGHSLVPSKLDKEMARVQVRTVTLSTLLKQQSADLIKVDVEGAEWQILRGAEDVLNKIKAWIIELHDINRKNEIERWFNKRGYKTSWVDSQHIYAVRPKFREKGELMREHRE